MRTIMTNIDQKDNENKELYSNNNLKITQMDRNKNIAASGSELETLQNQYLATKIALENNQEPKKQQKLTQACNKPEKHWKNIITNKTFQCFHSKSTK